MARYELPPDLPPEVKRAVIAALEQTLASARPMPPPWAVGGRVDALRLGALQSRGHLRPAWTLRGRIPFARRGTSALLGRGDAR